MKKVNLGIFIVFSLFLLSIGVFAAQISSDNYKQNVIISTGGENVSSSSYKIGIAVGIITKVIESASYINRLGFFHTILLANDQPCTSANQCEGGYCCSNLCKSSACPGGGGDTSGGAGGGSGGGGGGGGLAYVCNQDWQCNEWSECINSERTRQCEFIKVAQHAQETECPSLEKKPSTSQKCGADFTVSPSSIKEHLKLGAAKTKTITIKNNQDSSLNFNLKVLTVDNFVLLSDTRFSLDAEQEKTVEVNIFGKNLGSFLGEIEVESEDSKKSVILIIEVESEQVLFDVKLDIPSAYKVIELGSELRAQITLLNVGPPRKVDVTTTYLIKDKRGNVIHESSETFAVEKQTSFVKSFKIPETLRPDDYLVIIEVRYENSFAVSSELFKVVPKGSVAKSFVKFNSGLVIASIVAVGLIVLLTYPFMSRIRDIRKLLKKYGKRKK